MVLPDRLTHVVPKGADHPTPFAMGCSDSTPGGLFFGPAINPQTQTQTQEQIQTHSVLSVNTNTNTGGNSNQDYSGTGSGSGSSTGTGTGTGTGSIEEEEEYKPIFIAENKVDLRTFLTAAATDSSNNSSGSCGGNGNGSGSEFMSLSEYAKRHFSDDSHLQFDPREEFAGRRVGFVFRLGSLGLGYYEDHPPEVGTTISTSTTTTTTTCTDVSTAALFNCSHLIPSDSVAIMD